MLETAAREDGLRIGSAQQSHHLAAGVTAHQTDGATPPNRRITADSFRALKARLIQGKSAPVPPANAVQPAIEEPAVPVMAVTSPTIMEPLPLPAEPPSPPPPPAPIEIATPPRPLNGSAKPATFAEHADMEAILGAVFGPGASAWKPPEPEPAAVERPLPRASKPFSEPVLATVPESAAESVPAAPQAPVLEAEADEPLPVEAVPEPEPPPPPAEAAIEPEKLPETPSPPRPAPVKSQLRRRLAGEADPFAQAQVASVASATLPPVEIAEPDPQAGETARSLLDIMSASATMSQPQERALAADTLLRLIPRVPEKMLASLADRVAIMEIPPPLLVTRLIRDPRPDVAGPLLEKASHIPDRDLITVIGEGDPAKLRMIARRRHLSPALVDALIATGDASVLLTLVRNPGAAPSHEAFNALCEQAALHPALQAPLVTRPDTPVPTAFELFWFLPPELRRFVLSRFLTDSENLNRILKIALATGGGEMKSDDTTQEAQFPDRQRVENLVKLLVEGKTSEAAAEMTELAHICEPNALRIIADANGEPLTIALKVMGLPRAKFGEALSALQDSVAATLQKSRNPAELQSIFDSMSFNKARVLLTYWDWAAQKSGPYTRVAA
jgi:uncharacterized protein (DUF2336 family)